MNIKKQSSRPGLTFIKEDISLLANKSLFNFKILRIEKASKRRGEMSAIIKDELSVVDIWNVLLVKVILVM